jgi:hypothetical protein
MTYTAEQLELQAYIDAENAEFIAQAKASGSCFTLTPSNDLDMWAEYGVYNIEQYKHMYLVGAISDMQKELYGFRLRIDYSNSTVEQLEQELSDLHRYAQAEIDELAREEQERKDAIRKRNVEFAQSGNIMAQAFAKVKA